MIFRSSLALANSLNSISRRIFSGVIFASVLLAGTACKKGSGTPDWDTPGVTRTNSEKIATPPPAPLATVPAVQAKPVSTLAPHSAQTTETQSNEGLRFITYNVENWLTMDRYVNRKNLKGAPKPDSEKEAVIKILTKHTPDVIGLCEIGEASDLAEIQQKLKAAGLDLPHSHHTGGSDPTRHLGILSRFPIASTAKPAQLEYQLAGNTFSINRGILDATIAAHEKSYHFLGVHLKSKRDSEQGDQEAIRFNEALLLRKHINSIFATDSEARIIAYGDFNDTRSTPAIKTITGTYKDPGYLTALTVKDSNNETWTHHWVLNDIYSRIDFVMVSHAILNEVDHDASKIIDDIEWDKASDHRAVLAVFK